MIVDVTNVYIKRGRLGKSDTYGPNKGEEVQRKTMHKRLNELE